MKKVMINIQSYDDRNNMIISLANAGYNVTTNIETDELFHKTYWVVFEVPENNINKIGE